MPRRRYNKMPPLTQKAERALRKCIEEKWELIVSGDISEDTDCALCEIYIGDSDFASCSCIGCPVRQRTGAAFCRETPYLSWRQEAVYSDRPRSSKAITAARRELRFLKDTLRLGLKAREVRGG